MDKKTKRDRTKTKIGMGLSVAFCAVAGYFTPEAAPALAIAASVTTIAGGAHLALTDPVQR